MEVIFRGVYAKELNPYDREYVNSQISPRTIFLLVKTVSWDQNLCIPNGRPEHKKA